MPETDNTQEEIAARKLQSDIDFIRDQIEGNPDAAISAVSIEDGVVEALAGEGYVSEFWNGQHYFAKTAEILEANAAQRPPTE